MAIMAISIAPSGMEGTSLSAIVSKAIEVLDKQDRVQWELGSMFTTVEGELDDLFDIAKRMHEALAEAGAPRIGSVIKIDDRRDKVAHMKEKTDAIMHHLGKPLDES
ncbi:MTH1187 family thiamine-binding protein [bacterium]|nr:MTH1187 family thiamine-binding protein [bacterium]